MDHAAKTPRRAQKRRAASRRKPGEGLCPRGHVKDYVNPSGDLFCRICAKASYRKFSETRRQNRLRLRRQRIRQRAKPPKTTRVWAAGHFEGEGTITILSGGSRCVSLPRILLTSTDRAVIDFFQSTWPGHIQSRIPKSKNGLARIAHRWSLEANEAMEGFLLDMLPYFRTARVRAKAHLLLEDIRERVEYRQTQEERQAKRQRMARMRMLNRRGIARPNCGDGNDSDSVHN